MALKLFITSVEPGPVLVTVETLRGFHFTGYATNTDTLTVEIPNTFQVMSSEERDKGIRVTAENQSQIIIYGLNFERFTSDGFLALPCYQLPMNEYEYYAISYGHGYILVVGCEDDTLVQIGSIQTVLDEMETYFWESDVTGTRIISNKPLSVFVGSRCNNIPESSGYCDHLVEQVPPTASWGQKFMCASFPTRTSGDIYRIIGSRVFTTVTINCTTFDNVLTFTLPFPGSWQEFSTLPISYCSITADKPILVMQFALGNELDGIGDPFMMMITPTDHYSNNYVFNIIPEFSTNFISVYVTPDNFQPQDIFVDDASLHDYTWSAVYSQSDICGYITHVNLSNGTHQLYHSDASSTVGVSAYGFNYTNSYGYPGGLNIQSKLNIYIT